MAKNKNEVVLTLVSISYPILDGVLLVPAILILWSIRYGKLVVTHWMLIALSMIFVAIADSWIWDILYNAGYLSIAFALVWYNRFFIFNKKKSKKSGKKEIASYTSPDDTDNKNSCKKVRTTRWLSG